MIKTKNTLIAATAGTTFMTLFSYLVSMAADKNFIGLEGYAKGAPDSAIEGFY